MQRAKDSAFHLSKPTGRDARATKFPIAPPGPVSQPHGAMPDSPRLAELRRQRALLEEHLAWLDNEIRITGGGTAPLPATSANETGKQKSLPSSLPASSTPGLRAVAASPSSAGTDPDAILDQYRTSPASLQRDVRKGCLLYFVGAFVLLGAAVAALYFALRH